MKIGFIGIGVMGSSMARNLQKAGHELFLFTRTKEKTAELIKEGMEWCDTIAECVKKSQVVITMVGYPQDVEEVYFGSMGILEQVQKGTYLIDMTTTSPKLATKIFEKAKEKSCFALDAPVSGGDIGAKNGTLAIMVGGEEEAFFACLPLFQAMGKTIVYEGKAGSGQHTKMANQIAIAGVNAGLCEAMYYAEQMGLDVQKVLDTISTGAAGSWQMSNMAPRMQKGDFAPGFFIKHFIKDMNIALEESKERGMDLKCLNLVRDQYQELSNRGLAEEGTQAFIRYFKDDWGSK